MTNGEKLEELYKKFFKEPLPSNIEDKAKKIKKKLSNVFHEDLIAVLTQEMLEERLNIARGVFDDIPGSKKINNFPDVLGIINPMLDNFGLEYGTQKEKVISKEEAINKAKEMWEECKKRNAEFSGIIVYKYNLLEKRIKKIKEGSPQNFSNLVDNAYYSMYMFLGFIEQSYSELKELLTTLKELDPPNYIQIIESYSSELKQFEKLIHEQDPNRITITSEKTFNNKYIPFICRLKKDVAIQKLIIREYPFLNEQSGYYKDITDCLCHDINLVIADISDNQCKEKFEQKLEEILKEYRIKILNRNFVVTCYEQLKNKIINKGFTIDNFGVDIDSLLEIDDINKCKQQQIKLDKEIDLKVEQYTIIKKFKNKYSNNNYYINNLLNDVVLKINECETLEKVKYLENIAEKKLDYAIYVNSKIDKYLDDIRDNSRYSFSFDDIIRIFDKLRSYYNQYDSNYQIFDIEFSSLKSEIESKVDDDLTKAQSKKESLTNKISEDFENKIFISNHLSDICNKINEVKTFGGFGGLYNEIIKDELCNVLDNVKNLLLQSLDKHSKMKAYPIYVEQAIKVLNEIEKNIVEEKNISNSKIWGMNYKKLSKIIQCLGYNDCLDQFMCQESTIELLNGLYQKYRDESQKVSSTIKK